MITQTGDGIRSTALVSRFGDLKRLSRRIRGQHDIFNKLLQLLNTSQCSFDWRRSASATLQQHVQLTKTLINRIAFYIAAKQTTGSGSQVTGTSSQLPRLTSYLTSLATEIVDPFHQLA